VIPAGRKPEHWAIFYNMTLWV